MKTLESMGGAKKSPSFFSLTAVGIAVFISTSPMLCAQEARQAKVLAQYTLPPFSLAEFGHTEAELATALANGLPFDDLPAIGSGLQRLAGNHFVSVTDRGPTFTRTTPTPGRVFPLPTYTPSLVFFRAAGGKIHPKVIVPIVADDAGTPVTGIPNSATDDSVPFDSPTSTTQLPFNPNGLDLEDLRVLPDGKFIAVDEYSPSIVIISESGQVLKRYTPAGKTLAGSAYPVSDILPAILAQRRSNRGFEAVAVSKDGSTAYAMTQSPLGPTGSGTPTRNSRVLRVLKLDISDPLNLQVTAQYVFLLSPASEYPIGNRPQDLKLSSAAWVSEGRLLLLERSDELNIGGAKLILADLKNATDVTALPVAQTLALEDSSLDLASVGITPIATSVVYENEETPEITDFKLEGLSILNRNKVAITNDNDFGVGVTPPLSSTMWIIRLAKPIF
jgi:Esterase-like activity of phytase